MTLKDTFSSHSSACKRSSEILASSLPCSLAGASPQKPDSLLLGLSHRTLRGPGPVLRASASRAQAAPSLTPFLSTPSGVGGTAAPKIKHVLVPGPVNVTLGGKSVCSVNKTWFLGGP